MSASKIDVLVFSFEQDYGSREDCSVFYCRPLVVLAPESERASIKKIIEDTIEFESKPSEWVPEAGTYNEEFDDEALLQNILAAGYPAAWSGIDSYVNEG